MLGEAEATAGPALQAVADDIVPEGRAGEWTHALMDIGAGFCRPRTPRCDGCPLAGVCRFRALTGGVVGWSRVVAIETKAAPTLPFPRTTRWLRGRLLDLARATPDGAWSDVEAPLGDHDTAAIAAAATAMAAEGLLELHPTQPGRLRLPQ